MLAHFPLAMSSTTRAFEYPLNKSMRRMQTHVSRSQAGVQPFMRNRGPSSRRLVRIIWRSDFIRIRFCQILKFEQYQSQLTPPEPDDADALCILLLRTSAGAQMVVATVPATRDARKCVRMSSCNLAVDTKYCFAAEYLSLLLQYHVPKPSSAMAWEE